jgi:hypothetical protein
MPGLKVPALDYSLAKNLADTMPENGTILAPESVATWLPTFIAHPVLLSARGMYLVGAFGQDDGNRRLGLQMYVEGWQRAPDAPTALDKALDRYALTAVVVTRAVPWRMEIAQVLSGRGWHRMTQGPYDIWTRTASSALAPR